MALLTAREAAKRLGKDERTIRRWIEAGRLTARQTTSNRLAIDSQDVERLAAQLTESELAKRNEMILLEQRIQQLEDQQSAILARLALLEDQPRPADLPARSPRPARPRQEITILPEQIDLPACSRLAREFAETHGVNRVTFYEHMTKGIHGQTIEHLAYPNPSNPKEVKRWLSPDQQIAARDFWDREGKPWEPCENNDCLICKEYHE